LLDGNQAGSASADQQGDPGGAPPQKQLLVQAPGDPPAGQGQAAPVYPTALFPFEERSGAKDYGGKVSDLLFAKLAARSELFLVDRNDLKKVLQEQELNLSGVVRPAEAVRVGQLTGAKILVLGSVLQVDRRLHLIARIMGTETSRVVGAAVDGKVGDELGPLVDKLADAVVDTIAKQADKLVAPRVARTYRLAELNKKLAKKGKRPVVMIQIAERHVGRVAFDPAAQTEIMRYCKGTGFEVIDAEGAKGGVDVLITGEGVSELAARHGNLVSVKARVELKAVDRRTDKVLAVDRQTAVVVDLTEQLAGKAALQEAAALLAERILPKLVQP
jgi:TolB-like protein